jgi:hypothetical protein
MVESWDFLYISEPAGDPSARSAFKLTAGLHHVVPRFFIVRTVFIAKLQACSCLDFISIGVGARGQLLATMEDGAENADNVDEMSNRAGS